MVSLRLHPWLVDPIAEQSRAEETRGSLFPL